jgi:hypothetical protein
MDPTNSNLIDYEWFKFIHGKPAINDIHVAMEQYNYLYPVTLSDKSYLGGSRLHRIWHYHDKKLMESMNERTF